jgi:death-on-curing protein
MIYLTAEQVLFLHARIIAETRGSQGVRDLKMLLSALGRLQASFEQRDLYPDLFTKAAVLMDSLIRNHPFVDGNKRTGITAAAMFLQMNGFGLEVGNLELESFTMEVAQSRQSIDEMAAWFQVHAIPVDGT